jgi:hypothetical protein
MSKRAFYPLAPAPLFVIYSHPYRPVSFTAYPVCFPLNPLGIRGEKSPVLATVVTRVGLGWDRKTPLRRVGWVEKGGWEKEAAVLYKHAPHWPLCNRPTISRLLFVKIPPSFTKGRGLGG